MYHSHTRGQTNGSSQSQIHFESGSGWRTVRRVKERGLPPLPAMVTTVRLGSVVVTSSAASLSATAAAAAGCDHSVLGLAAGLPGGGASREMHGCDAGPSPASSATHCSWEPCGASRAPAATAAATMRFTSAASLRWPSTELKRWASSLSATSLARPRSSSMPLAKVVSAPNGVCLGRGCSSQQVCA